MLSHVHHLIEGQIQETLHGEVMMTIRTRDLPEYVPAESRQFSQPYFADSTGVFPNESIVEGLAAGNQALLLLGEPGAGKTVALLLCAQALVARALREADAPLPVLFNLSTWARQRKPLKEWMSEQLGRPGYGVPEQVASAWIELGTILPLLDGLDEVPPHSILGCIHAINGYRPANGIRPSIVVCCRLEEYKPHVRQLAVQRVLLIEPPAQAQIDQYLANPKLAGLKQALAYDKGLRELGQTPLMLSLMALAFTNVPAPSILIQEGSSDVPLEQRREEFFARYVKVQLAREYRQITGRYRTDDTLRWLPWLANVLHAHNEVRFYVETLPPRLFKHWVLFLTTIMIVFGLFDGALFGFIAYWVYGIHVALIVAVAGFLFGSFLGALGGKGVGSIGLRDKLKLDTGTVFVAPMYGTVFAIAVGLVYGLFIGVAVGAVVGIIGGLFGSLGSIPLRRGRKIDISGVAVGLIMGYVFNSVYGLTPGIVVGFLAGLLIGLAFGSVLDLANSTPQSLRDSGCVRVNSGMLRTRNYGIAFGVLCGGVTSAVIGIEYGVVIGIGVGVVCGLLVSFGVGLGDYVKYCSSARL